MSLAFTQEDFLFRIGMSVCNLLFSLHDFVPLLGKLSPVALQCVVFFP